MAVLRSTIPALSAATGIAAFIAAAYWYLWTRQIAESECSTSKLYSMLRD